MILAEVIEEFNERRPLSDQFKILEEAAGAYGFDQVAYGTLTYYERSDDTDQTPPAVVLNYPTDWQEYYFEQNFQEIDPVVVHTPNLSGPYLWKWLPKLFNLDSQQLTMLDEARESGLKDGISIPLHGPWGRVAVVSFASRDGNADSKRLLYKLQLLASQFHVAVEDTIYAQRRHYPTLQLSQRERECLKWVAQGKSSWDIGMILGISDNTVNFHLKNIMRKLDTSSRTVALLRALQLGLIQI